MKAFRLSPPILSLTLSWPLVEATQSVWLSSYNHPSKNNNFYGVMLSVMLQQWWSRVQPPPSHPPRSKWPCHFHHVSTWIPPSAFSGEVKAARRSWKHSLENNPRSACLQFKNSFSLQKSMARFPALLSEYVLLLGQVGQTSYWGDTRVRQRSWEQRQTYALFWSQREGAERTVISLIHLGVFLLVAIILQGTSGAVENLILKNKSNRTCQLSLFGPP